jgi:hypothetical protein
MSETEREREREKDIYLKTITLLIWASSLFTGLISVGFIHPVSTVTEVIFFSLYFFSKRKKTSFY